MNKGVLGYLTVCVLDYNRPKESEVCLRSIKQLLNVTPIQILYLSNGGDQSHARRFYDEGLVDSLLLNKTNVGCGIATKQMVSAALTEWVMIVQSDQFLFRPFTQIDFNKMVETLNHPNCQSILYVDLAGNQGHGKYSERSHLINRRRYLDIPGMDDVIGGPGPFAQSVWTEKHIQDYMTPNPYKDGLSFVSDASTYFFQDNGKWSEREYGPEYGNAKTRHSTDEKKLFILSPFSRRADGFPNLNLTDEEWNLVLSNQWPEQGRIPEKDVPHSFVVWPEEQ